MNDNNWQFNQENILERRCYLLKTGAFSDCKFIVNKGDAKKEFKAHKLILSMTSPVFEKMFQNGFDESENDIKIVDIQPEIFGAMLEYVYLDSVNIISFDEACGLYDAAHKYMLPFLEKSCLYYIKNNANFENACQGLEFARLFTQHQLEDTFKQIITSETIAIVQHSSFSEIQLSTLKYILNSDKIDVSEIILFTAAQKWLCAEYERRDIQGPENIEKQQALNQEIISSIRFMRMTAKEFSEGPALSGLLTLKQSYEILSNLSSSKPIYPLTVVCKRTTRGEKPQVNQPTTTTTSYY